MTKIKTCGKKHKFEEISFGENPIRSCKKKEPNNFLKIRFSKDFEREERNMSVFFLFLILYVLAYVVFLFFLKKLFIYLFHNAAW